MNANSTPTATQIKSEPKMFTRIGGSLQLNKLIREARGLIKQNPNLVLQTGDLVKAFTWGRIVIWRATRLDSRTWAFCYNKAFFDSK